MQKACQIIVADSENRLKGGKYAIWDSGRMETERSLLVEYKGTRLESGHTYFWKVRTCDMNGQPSGWSDIQHITMGLTGESDWHDAKWIALEQHLWGRRLWRTT